MTHLITSTGGPGRPRHVRCYSRLARREEGRGRVPEAAGDADDGNSRMRRRDEDTRCRGEREGVGFMSARPFGLRRQREGAVHPRLRPCPVSGQPLASRAGVRSGLLCGGVVRRAVGRSAGAAACPVVVLCGSSAQVRKWNRASMRFRLSPASVARASLLPEYSWRAWRRFRSIRRLPTVHWRRNFIDARRRRCSAGAGGTTPSDSVRGRIHRRIARTHTKGAVTNALRG